MMHKPLNQTARDLMAARDLIDEPHKWCKRYETIGGTRHCMVGAIKRVITNDGDLVDLKDRYLDAFTAIVRAISWANDLEVAIVSFNDARSTTHADVMRVMNYAIRAAT